MKKTNQGFTTAALTIVLVIFMICGILYIFSKDVTTTAEPGRNKTDSTMIGKVSSINNELTIVAPVEFYVSPESAIRNGDIFVATSSDDLLAIKTIGGGDGQVHDQGDALQYIFKEYKSRDGKSFTEGSGTGQWSNTHMVVLGNNNFIVSDAIQTGTINGQLIQKNVRRYTTYDKLNFYMITFANYSPSKVKTAYWDSIVATIEFK